MSADMPSTDAFVAPASSRVCNRAISSSVSTPRPRITHSRKHYNDKQAEGREQRALAGYLMAYMLFVATLNPALSAILTTAPSPHKMRRRLPCLWIRAGKGDAQNLAISRSPG